TFVEGRREILRQASVALGGRPVTVWEVSVRAELEPQASSEPAPTHHATKLDVDATLRRWNITIVQGSRWVGCRGAGDGDWVVAPVRTRPPAPPPEGRERRRRSAARAARRARSGGGGYRPFRELPARREGPRARRPGAIGAVRCRARRPLLLHAREPRPQRKEDPPRVRLHPRRRVPEGRPQ